MEAEECFAIDLLMSRWFDRTWTVQEIVASTEARLLCGDQTMLWSDLVGACEFLKAHGTRHTGLVRCYQTIDMELAREAYLFWRLYNSTDLSDAKAECGELLEKHMDAIMQVAKASAQTRSFDRLFTLFTMREVTDPRDTIFAMLNILSRFQGCIIENLIDYSVSPRKVYLNATQLWMRSSKLSGIPEELSKEKLVGWSATEVSFFDFVVDLNFNKELNLPSWVPSWRGKSGTFYRDPNFCASIAAEPYLIPPHPNLFDDDDIPLCVRGVKLFKVSAMSPVMANHKVSVSEHQEMLHQFMDPYPTTEETFASVYAGTLDLEATQMICQGSRTCKVWDVIRGQPRIVLNSSSDDKSKSLGGTLEESSRLDLNPALYKSNTFEKYTKMQNLFVSLEGFLGLGPPGLQIGDIICLLFGGATPYILRELEPTRFTFLGNCLVYGVMSGEAIEDVPEDRV